MIVRSRHSGTREITASGSGAMSGKSWPARTNVIVGVVVEFTYRIDDRQVVIEEVGTPEGAYMQAHDGERLKKAVSDATKRAAARVGVGLHLWSRGPWFLPRMLGERSAA